jgi:hypothetical protein
VDITPSDDNNDTMQTISCHPVQGSPMRYQSLHLPRGEGLPQPPCNFAPNTGHHTYRCCPKHVPRVTWTSWECIRVDSCLRCHRCHFYSRDLRWLSTPTLFMPRALRTSSSPESWDPHSVHLDSCMCGCAEAGGKAWYCSTDVHAHCAFFFEKKGVTRVAHAATLQRNLCTT